MTLLKFTTQTQFFFTVYSRTPALDAFQNAIAKDLKKLYDVSTGDTKGFNMNNMQ